MRAATHGYDCARLRDHARYLGGCMMFRLTGAALIFAAIGLIVLSGCESERRAANSKGNAPAIVLIDLQQSFLNSEGASPVAQEQVEPLIKATNAMIDAARK